MSASGSSIAVFLGPSLPHEEAAAILDATYLPPAQFGDVYRLLGGGLRAIVLVDGVFHGRAPVWQRELLSAIEDGIHVYGASSMGALRAAELHSHGMVGLGTIHGWYASGEIDGDDEVALLHASPEQRYRPLTEPLVNLRFNLTEAAARGIVAPDEAAALIAALAAMPFWERSTSALWETPACRALDPARLARLRDFFAGEAIDLKRRDAMLALAEVARREREIGPGLPAPLARSAAGPSHHDRFRLLERAFPRPAGAPILGRTIAERVLDEPARRRLIRWSLSARFLARQWASDTDDRSRFPVLQDEALLSAVPDIDIEALRPVASRAVIAQALPHVAGWCERSGAEPPPQAKASARDRWRPALDHLVALGHADACDPFLHAVWAIASGPVHLGYATWSLDAELLTELQTTGALAPLLRWLRQEGP